MLTSWMVGRFKARGGVLMKIIWPALFIFLLHASVQAADKIKVAIPPGVHAYIPLAQKKGFFKEEGLDAEVIEMRSPAVAVVALANGEIDYLALLGLRSPQRCEGCRSKLWRVLFPVLP